MVKKTLVLILGALGACTQPATTPLAKLASTFGDTSIEIVAKGQVNIELHVASDKGCPLLGEDVVARFDGQPMNVTRGGYDVDSTGCYPIAFSFSPVPIASITAWERTSSTSELIVEDASATWTMGSTRLFANQFQIDAMTSRVIWEDVTEIATAIVEPPAPITIDGNSILYPAGATIDWVDAYAHPATTRCDGPATCTVDLEGSRHFGPINP